MHTRTLDLFRLDGRVALITGATGGLGAAIATALAEAGASVAVHGNRRAAEETAQAIGRKATAFQAPLGEAKGPERLFNSVQAHFGRVDILVNNAGTIHREAAVETSLESWQQVLQVNLTSVFQLSQLAARDMMARNSPGKIINIASLLSFQGGIRVPAYAASKGGVAQLTKALANEWASSNKSLVPYPQCSARRNFRLPMRLVRSIVDTAICAKPLARWTYGDWMPPAGS
jgi:2-deoxy-D-gluconate 3-dehydrogenase